MKTSILHLSDLHRDLSNEISNSALIESLCRDRERYVDDENIQPPDLVVISGDLIQGAKLDDSDATKEIERQYEQAEEFLTNIANEFLSGNKQKIIIVPGNHDVNSEIFMSSINKVDIDNTKSEYKNILVNRLFSPNSNIRWSWKTLEFYEINNREQYEQRMDKFSEFINRFYDKKHTFDLNPENQFLIYDYPEFNISFAGLNSCFNNDLFNRQSDINPICIAKACKQLNVIEYRSRLKVAVWHHNTQGPPLQSDYMDSGILQVLIDNGFSMGLHGHQHKPLFIDEKFQLGKNRKITVISAGTLCGSPGSLPNGYPRSYNLIEIDNGNDNEYAGLLHLRAMINEKFDYPIWGQRIIPPEQDTSVAFEIQSPPVIKNHKADEISLLSKADDALQIGNYQKVIDLLTPIINTSDSARPLLLQSYFELEIWDLIITLCSPPISTREIIYVLQAHEELCDMDALKMLIQSDLIKNNNDLSVKEQVRRISKRLHL